MACPGEFQLRRDADYETCSYCGSVRAEDMLRAIEDGYSVLPTDKNYKLYVMMPNKEPTKPKIVGSANGDRPGHDWQKPTEELLRDSGMSLDNNTWVLVRPVGPTTQMKFYMDHMAEDQWEVFINLYKGGVMNVAYPGHFYAWGI